MKTYIHSDAITEIHTNPAPCGIACAGCPLETACAQYQEFLNHVAASDSGLDEDGLSNETIKGEQHDNV